MHVAINPLSYTVLHSLVFHQEYAVSSFAEILFSCSIDCFFLVSAENGAAISELENLTIRLLDEFYSSVLFDK